MSLGVFNQASWSGIGDVDECWIIATYWALVASGVMRRQDLPTIAEFREAAGRPDLRGPSGGNNRDLMLALRTLVPQADAKRLVGGTLAEFKKELGRGYIASLSVRSSRLPKYLQFGFQGSHQVSVFYKGGKFYVMNPLAKEGSALIQISERDLIRAAGGLFGDGKFHAVLIKSRPRDAKKIKKFLPQRPRDLAAPIIVRNYIDPWAAGRSYDERHRRKSGGLAVDRAGDRQ